MIFFYIRLYVGVEGMFLVTALFFSKSHVGAAPQSKLTPAEISHHQKHQIAARYINTMLLVVSFFSSVKKLRFSEEFACNTLLIGGVRHIVCIY